MKNLLVLIVVFGFAIHLSAQSYEWNMENTASSPGERVVLTIDAGSVGPYDGISITGDVIDNMGNWGYNLPVKANFSCYINFTGSDYEIVQSTKTDRIALRLRQISSSVIRLTANMPYGHCSAIVNLTIGEQNGISAVTLGDPNTIDSSGTLVVSSPTYQNVFSGYFGIGTSSPQAILDINAQTEGDAVLRLEADTNNANEDNNPRIEMYQDGGIHGAFIGFNSDWGGNYQDNLFRIGTRTNGNNNYNNITINPTDGNVGIGTISPDSKLTVAGNIHAQEVKVTVNAGADFVFADDYNLPSLKDVEQFIKNNKHLPEIASEKEMQNNGLLLAEMDIKLLQKIEELMLYTIEQEKKIESQEKVNQDLKERLLKLEQVLLKEEPINNHK